ncbi:sigma-70 family RNA polymerase sigma factor [Arenibacter aquaticus]|uniref:Sigma-70 family RNA polymerase sigma factor n=1 Tax=Arenibacter aquaticus TaxID=2489054 RepID=A0A3S0B153_9FLAO|nr:sigma-70 family RNA polymerase sigma factor [Arenibacter aquaticus]RTE55272.1 sigma-70 family RNA polymerase sigma factor [Arenibacter aquaticus]
MTNTNPDHNTLINQLVSENEEAYELLVGLFYKKLLVYAYSLCSDYPQAQDIVQNVFLRVWERRGNLMVKQSLSGLLHRAVYNEFIDTVRKNKPTYPLDELYWSSLNNVVDEANKQLLEEKINLVKREVEHLPSKCKQVFLLSKRDGLTNVEIATYLNVSIKTVEYQIAHAYKAIRKGAEVKIKKLVLMFFSMVKSV